MTTLVQLTEGQYQPATAANELFKSVSPAGIFGRKHTTTTGLTWGYYGGYLNVAGTLTSISDGTVSLTGSTTNYVESTTAGVVSANATAFTPGRIRLYTVTTGVSTISSYIDYRDFLIGPNVGGVLNKLWTSDANVTLVAAESAARFIALSSGGLSTTRDLIVPNQGAWTIVNSTTGGQSVRIITASGNGITIATGKAAMVFANSLHIIRATADVAPNA